MEIKITIQCTDDDEALNHLSDIRKKVKKFLNDVDEKSTESKSFVHNNCDGYSETIIDLS